MTGVRAARLSWLEWFPVQQEILDEITDDGETPFILDVGGGRGHDLEAFRERFPTTTNRLILQDLPNVIQGNDALDGIQQMEYDLFNPQPVHGKSELITWRHCAISRG